MFKILENHSFSYTMARFLEERSWRAKLTSATKVNTGTGELWIWAEISLRLCLNQKYYEGAYEILQMLAKLPFTSAGIKKYSGFKYCSQVNFQSLL